MARTKKIKTPKLNTCYFIEWNDAYASDGKWKDLDALDEFTGQGDFFVWNLGWLKKETKYSYVFAAAVIPGQDNAAHLFSIPKAMIQRLEEVTWKNK